ncbi:class I SAM-dependent methyltransferase [Candidatus Poribacteria bacterium]|nr:MAG: class I SAM-dependent methyltransferase [Candidatus Poribacteria bacterium]
MFKDYASEDFDNLLEYTDVVIYDAEIEAETKDPFMPDGPFYLSLARQLGGKVLELGCGTGRYTIPLAERGVDITGLDIMPQMLTRAKSKAKNLSIRWIEADVRTFHLNEQFDLIIETGGTFQHLLMRADQEAMLQRVHEHLKQNGYFVVSVVFPHLFFLQDHQEEYAFSYTTEDGREVSLSVSQQYDHLRQIWIDIATRRWKDGNGQEVIKRVPLARRLIFPQEMEMLLQYNGFAVVDRYGDWDKGPLTNDSNLMIYVCQKIG